MAVVLDYAKLAMQQVGATCGPRLTGRQEKGSQALGRKLMLALRREKLLHPYRHPPRPGRTDEQEQEQPCRAKHKRQH